MEVTFNLIEKESNTQQSLFIINIS